MNILSTTLYYNIKCIKQNKSHMSIKINCIVSRRGVHCTTVGTRKSCMLICVVVTICTHYYTSYNYSIQFYEITVLH